MKTLKQYITESTNLTYGVLPNFTDFKKSLMNNMGSIYKLDLKFPDNRTVSMLGLPTNGNFNAAEMYSILGNLVKAKSDDANELAKKILSTLGFNWK